jgi:hypothetical protein
MRDVTVATITLARTDDEMRVLRAALERLASTNLRVAVADGGSPPAFVEFVRHLPLFQLRPPAGSGLVAQVKASLHAASEAGSAWVLYTEPDKEQFFDGKLAEFISRASEDDSVGVVVASRDEPSFATFPPMQQLTESAFNRLCADAVGANADYCYGPFLMRRTLIETIDRVPDDAGWGWRPYLFATTTRRGHRVASVSGGFPCPPDQRHEGADDRIHRMRQLAQNVSGLVLALS